MEVSMEGSADTLHLINNKNDEQLNGMICFLFRCTNPKHENQRFLWFLHLCISLNGNCVGGGGGVLVGLMEDGDDDEVEDTL